MPLDGGLQAFVIIGDLSGRRRVSSLGADDGSVRSDGEKCMR